MEAQIGIRKKNSIASKESDKARSVSDDLPGYQQWSQRCAQALYLNDDKPL